MKPKEVELEERRQKKFGWYKRTRELETLWIVQGTFGETIFSKVVSKK